MTRPGRGERRSAAAAAAVSLAVMAAAAAGLVWTDFLRPGAGPLGASVRAPLPPARTPPPPVRTRTGLDYSLTAVAQGAAPAPRLFHAAVPQAALDEPDTQRRKRLFFKTVLPLILAVNEDVLRDRRRLLALDARAGRGGAPDRTEQEWLARAAQRYALDGADLDALLMRADAVPPSLALAQAAKESGWGRSRFAREGNALFGQWTVKKSDAGMVPEGRGEGRRHRVKAFETLRASVRAYVRNLNTHKAYLEFRRARARLRADGRPLSGAALAGTLTRYSELGAEYTERIKAMIRENGLAALDAARLQSPGAPPGA